MTGESESALDSEPASLIELLSSEEEAIEIVDLRPSTITSCDVRNIMLPLITNASVRILYLPLDRTDFISSKTMAMILKNNIGTPIEELHLSHFPPPDQGASSISVYSNIISSLKSNKTVKKLHIAPEVVLHESIQASIASVLYDDSVISSLMLRNCGLSNTGVTKISCALANNSSITVLDLSNNQLGNKGTCSVALALEMNKTIQKLKLSGTNIGREGGEAMVTALATNDSLEVLDMSRNSLDDTVITKLAKMLKTNESLRQMSLRSNQFSTIGALCLSLALYDRKNIHTVLSCNHTIQYLDINSNQLSRECVMHVNKSLRWNAQRSSKNETIRKKVSSFLAGSDSNCSCLKSYLGDASIANKLMPNMLWSVGSNSTALYFLFKNLMVPLSEESSSKTLSRK